MSDLELTQYVSEIDGAHVVEIDTRPEHGRIRIYLNDGPVYDADPEAQPEPRLRLGSLVFPTAESHSQCAVLLPITEQTIAEAHAAASTAAQSDSNDDEIERLWELVEVLLGTLQIEEGAQP